MLIQQDLPEGISHLHGDLYLVHHSLIEYADNGFDLDGGELIFQNPRHISSGTDGKPMGSGFSKAEMDELRESLRTEGMKNPLSTRWLPDHKKVQIVDGERRKRSLDKLRKDKSEVYVPSTGQYAPAVDHYDFIECRIEEMSEETALKHSISMTERSRSFGEGALVLIVRHLRNCGKDDNSILEIMGKSPSWLKQSDDILSLDNKTFQAFCGDKINRTVALQLISIPDVSKRIKLLGKATEIAKQRISEELKKIDEQLEQAESEFEEAEAEGVVAKVLGTEVDKKRANKKVKVARDKVAKKKKSKTEVEEKTTAKVIGGDLQKAAKEEGLEGNEVRPKSLTGVKVKKHYIDILVSVINSGLKDEEGNEMEFDIEDLHLAKTVCEFIYNGEKDVFKAVKQHMFEKAHRSKNN